MLNKGIGIGYVNSEYSKPDTIVQIKVRNKFIKAKVVKFPIYKGWITNAGK